MFECVILSHSSLSLCHLCRRERLVSFNFLPIFLEVLSSSTRVVSREGWDGRQSWRMTKKEDKRQAQETTARIEDDERCMRRRWRERRMDRKDKKRWKHWIWWRKRKGYWTSLRCDSSLKCLFRSHTKCYSNWSKHEGRNGQCSWYDAPTNTFW